MNILHITPHLGGGLGTVIGGWVEKDRRNHHRIVCLDYVNDKAKRELTGFLLGSMTGNMEVAKRLIPSADIVVCHYYDHPILTELFSYPIPDCRLIFWCHKNIQYSQKEVDFPDIWIDTSPIQGHGKYIWSTGNMNRFMTIKLKQHEGFNVGYIGTVDYRKMHPNWLAMCWEIIKAIPDVHFTIVGEQNIGITKNHDDRWTFTSKVDDVVLYLSEMDVFGYPLRSDHYGTCEQVLGEAMAAGIVPVCMDNPAEKLIIEDGKNGYLEPDEANYIDAIRFLYKHPDARSRMGNRVRNRAQQIYSIDVMISKWNEVFESMMQQPKKSRGIL